MFCHFSSYGTLVTFFFPVSSLSHDGVPLRVIKCANAERTATVLLVQENNIHEEIIPFKLNMFPVKLETSLTKKRKTQDHNITIKV